VLNLFAEVEGTLPIDKEKVTAPLREFLQLSPHQQMVFCIGRRNHRWCRSEWCRSDEDPEQYPFRRIGPIQRCQRFRSDLSAVPLCMFHGGQKRIAPIFQ